MKSSITNHPIETSRERVTKANGNDNNDENMAMPPVVVELMNSWNQIKPGGVWVFPSSTDHCLAGTT